MCGILAILTGNAEPLNPALTARGLSAMRHRGPDAQAVRTFRGGRVALAHARLGIVGIESGAQPISNEDGTIHAVVAGEFYGFEDIRKELEGKGHRFQTRTDSEILIHLYEEHGTGCLGRLRGEFSFVLWDDAQATLFAARDRFGIKPLFHTRHEGRFYFASEVKALFAAGVPAGWDTFAYASSIINIGGRTLFKDVQAIPPGHFMVVHGTTSNVHSYWDFNYPRERDVLAVDEREAIERVRAAIVRSVRDRLRADVPVGIYLSGGVDSCSLLGAAAQLSEVKPKAFGVAFDDAQYDESELAAAAARRVGVDFERVDVTAADLADHFADTVWHCESVLANGHAVAKFLLSRAVHRAGMRCVLTGEGADEIFGGYPHFKSDMIQHAMSGCEPSEREARLAELARDNQASAGLLLSSKGEIEQLGFERLRKLLGSVPSFMIPMKRGFTLGKGLWPDDLTQAYGCIDNWVQFVNELPIGSQLAERHPVHQAMYVWSKQMLPAYLLSTLGDRVEMAHSVEGRLPFLDHELVETVVSLPAEMKIRGSCEKYILREAMKPYISESTYRVQKHPFLSPPSALNQAAPFFCMVQDLLRSQHAKSLPFVDATKLVGLLDALPRMPSAALAGVDGILMSLASACVLQEKFSL